MKVTEGTPMVLATFYWAPTACHWKIHCNSNYKYHARSNNVLMWGGGGDRERTGEISKSLVPMEQYY